MRKDMRASPRVRVGRQVIVSNLVEARFCQIRDISAEGLFVTSAMTGLGDGASVYITLSLPSGVARKVYRLPARVVRVTSEGLGIRFERLNLDSYGAILGLMCIT